MFPRPVAVFIGENCTKHSQENSQTLYFQAAKLRSLYSQSEQRCEERQEQLNDMTIERERMSAKIEHLTQENNRSLFYSLPHFSVC